MNDFSFPLFPEKKYDIEKFDLTFRLGLVLVFSSLFHRL